MTKNDKFSFNTMVFPNGPICNLNCEYCYYLDKTKYYENNVSFRMTEELLEKFIKQYIQAQPGPIVNFGWQGGEPTLRGIDFYKKVVELQKKYLPEGWECQNSFQTNAILIDEEWCEFLSDNNFLMGVSIDGPDWIHNHYRKGNDGEPTYQKVVEGIKLMQEYDVDYNLLCVVNDLNSQHPLEVYRTFKKIGAEFLQFIPIVETGDESNNEIVSSRSVKTEDYAVFLISIFDEWLRNDFGEIFIQIFEEVLTAQAGYSPSLCVFSEHCGNASVMEHNGDLYSCDHFVFPEYKLGNIKNKTIMEMMHSKQQSNFGRAKKEGLPELCKSCEVNFICHGGCPKNRIVKIIDDKNKLNYLCNGYKRFFKYINPYAKEIVSMLKKKKPSSFIKKRINKLNDEIWDIGRNDPCSCGSEKKYKKCCLDRKEI